MRKPFSYMAVSLAVLGQAGTAAALGLGEIELNSSLNQPLSANIRLLQADGLGAEEILITLAPGAEFERAGIDRAALLADLRFAIATDAEGRRVIRVSTREPLREPYLDFLLEVQWPQGKMVREFTLLLDPPDYVVKQQPVMAPVVRPAPTVPTPAPAPMVAVPVPPPVHAAAAPPAESAGLHRVGSSGNTLWAIAKAVRPSSEVTLQQTMMALKELNPDAFVNGNINRLKRGALLQIPSTEQIKQRSASVAAQAVEQELHSWRQLRDGTATAKSSAPAPALTTTTGAAAVAAKAPDAELKLVAPAAPEAKPAKGGAGSKKEAASTEELTQKLALTLESLDRLAEENKELKARQDEISQQMLTMQKLLNLKDAQLATLQAKLATEQSAETSTADGGPAAKSSVPGEAAEQGFMAAVARLAAEPLYLAASAGAVILAALLAALGLRQRAKRQQSADSYPADGDFIFDDDSVPVATVNATAPEEISPSASPFAVPGQQKNGPRAEPVTRAMPETSDPLTEADIYLAYGRYEPAIALLTGAIEQEPKRSDFWLKLLEIHAERKDATAFEAAKQKLDALGDPLAIQRAAELKAALGGISAESASVGFSFEPAAPVAAESGFSSFATTPQSAPAYGAPGIAAVAQPDAMKFDFDLAGSSDELLSRTETSASPSESSFEPLEFESSLFERPVDTSAAAQAKTAKVEEIDFEFDFNPELQPAAQRAVPSAGDIDLAAPLADALGTQAEVQSIPAASFDEEEDMDLDTLHMRMREEMAAKLATMQSPAATGEEEDLDSLHRRAREEMQSLLSSDLSGSVEEVSAAPVPHPPSEPLFHPVAESNSEFVDETFSFLAGTDEISTKLDLARAYIDMGDHEGAMDILEEVLAEGDQQQQQEATELLARLG